MKNRLGRRIELLIFSKGFDSIRSFAKCMEEENPANCVGVQTISNVINGRRTTKETLMAIAECLELPLEILTNENLIFIDDFLENEISPIKSEKNSDDYTRKFAMGTVKYLYDLSNRFCPLSISDEFGLSEGFHIATMSEMVLYLPLCRLYHLYDLISRIGGDIDGREGYILKQSEFLYETIPDIPAKHYVDNCIMKYRIEKKEKLDENEEKEKQRLEKYWCSEEMQRDYKHYYDIVQQWFKLSQDDTMRCILEQKFPEVYAEDIEYRKECLKNK